MTREIQIYDLALDDIACGINYYQSQQHDLGNRFEQQIHASLDKIKDFPFAASIAYENVRYKIVEHFPYIILYQVDEVNIYILRVFNTYQKPMY